MLFNNIRLLTWSVYNYKEGIKSGIINKSDKLPIDYNKEFLIYGKDKDIYDNNITKENIFSSFLLLTCNLVFFNNICIYYFTLKI